MRILTRAKIAVEDLPHTNLSLMMSFLDKMRVLKQSLSSYSALKFQKT